MLGSAAISAILTMVAISTTDSTKTFPTTFSTLPLLMGWSLGGQFVMSGSNSYETITLTFTLLRRWHRGLLAGAPPGRG